MSTVFNNNHNMAKNVLGNYVYLNWENYKQAGTWNYWTVDGESIASNFRPDRFSQHEKNVRALIAKLAVPNLAALEQDYNTSLQNRNETMKNLFLTDVESFQGIIDILIRSLGRSYAAKAQQYVNNTTWDSTHDRPVVNLRNIALKTENFPAPPRLTVKAEVQRGQCAPRILFCQQMKEYIKNLVDGTQDEIQKNPDIIMLNEIETQLQDISQEYRKIKNIVSAEAKAFELSKQEAAAITNRLEAIRAGYLDIKKLNELLWAAWAEFTGNALEVDLEKITWREIASALDIGKLRTQASAAKEKVTTVTLNTDYAKQWCEQHFRAAKKKSEELSNKETKALARYSRAMMNFQTLGSSVSNKRDIEVTLAGQKYGISMKNTNLLASANVSEELADMQIPSVELQTSSLALYLAALEAETGALGTHYMNIFATHNDTDGIYDKMRADANRSFSLYVLYSAITGEGQLRQQPKVHIFAIYDKAAKNGKHRVKFYDMADLILRVTDHSSSHSFLNPKIETLTLNNDAEEKVSYRITKLLLEARNQTIEAHIENRLLQSIYANRS